MKGSTAKSSPSPFDKSIQTCLGYLSILFVNFHDVCLIFGGPSTSTAAGQKLKVSMRAFFVTHAAITVLFLLSANGGMECRWRNRPLHWRRVFHTHPTRHGGDDPRHEFAAHKWHAG